MKCTPYISEGKATLKKFMQFYAIFEILFQGYGPQHWFFRKILLQLIFEVTTGYFKLKAKKNGYTLLTESYVDLTYVHFDYSPIND